MSHLRPAVWLIAWLGSSLLALPAAAETQESEDRYRACLAEVREEMLRSEMKSLDPKVQETVAGLCRRGETEAAVVFAVPAAAPRRCSRRVSEAAARAESKLGTEEVGRAHQLCRRGEIEAALAIVEGASPEEHEAQPPAIVSFQAARPQVSPGETVVLSWETENASAVYLGRVDPSDPSGFGDRREVASSGSETVKPSATTTYSLLAQGSGERSTMVASRVTVQVDARPIDARPIIHRFQARPPTIRRGEASRLTWDVYAGEARLDDEIVPARGDRVVRPAETTRYFLDAVSGREAVEEVAAVTVSPYPPARLASPIRSIQLCREIDTSGGDYRCVASDGPFYAGDPVQVLVRFAELADGEHHLEHRVSRGTGMESTKWTLIDRATGPFQYRTGRPAATAFKLPDSGTGARKLELIFDRREATRSEILFCVECPGHDEW